MISNRKVVSDGIEILEVSPELRKRVLPRHKLDLEQRSPRNTYDMINAEMFFETNPRLNLATFVSTTMEKEAGELMAESFNKNFIDKPEYPQTMEIQMRCVSILSNLFHAEEDGAGTATVGSSEAIHLCGLAFKWRWKKWFKESYRKDPQKLPNIVMGSNVQICWKKFCTYFDVKLIEVPLNNDNKLPASVLADYVDEYTIGVVGILGNTYSGEFDDIEAIDEVIEQINREKGYQIPVHVDAASGGFIAPFTNVHKDIVWDFRLKNVHSINVSGHKYGLVYPGIGWAIWKSERYIPEELIFEVSYLGESQKDFGLNFSRGSGQIIGQYYNFVRYGQQGYEEIMNNLMIMYYVLKESILAFEIQKGVPVFIQENHEKGLPLLAVSLNPDITEFDLTDLSHELEKFGWILPAYNMSAPKKHLKIMRMVIRRDFTPEMIQKLIEHLEISVEILLGQKERIIKTVKGGHGVC